MNALALRMLNKIFPVKGRHARPVAPLAPAVLVDAFLPTGPCFATVIDLTAIETAPVLVRACASPVAARAARVLARTSR